MRLAFKTPGSFCVEVQKMKHVQLNFSFPRGEPFTRKEDEAMLKYVLKHYNTVGNSTLKGRYLWESMERANVSRFVYLNNAIIETE